MKKSYYAIAIPFLSALLIACGSGSKVDKINEEDNKRLNDNANSSTTAPVTENSPPVDTADALAREGFIVSGDWEVGTKANIPAGVIAPGTYVITAGGTGINCYWETVRNFNHELDSIIANGNIDPGKTIRVVVKKSYAGLTLEGDCLGGKKK